MCDELDDVTRKLFDIEMRFNILLFLVSTRETLLDLKRKYAVALKRSLR